LTDSQILDAIGYIDCATVFRIVPDAASPQEALPEMEIRQSHWPEEQSIAQKN
jgi:hypothetical protein